MLESCYFIFFHCRFQKALFIWLHWAFIAACGLSLVVISRGWFLVQCLGFSLQWLVLLQHAGCRACGLSSWSAQTLLSRGMWDVPWPGIEPMSCGRQILHYWTTWEVLLSVFIFISGLWGQLKSSCSVIPWSRWSHLPQLGRSLGEGNGSSLQYSCLGNLTDSVAWQAVHGVAENQTQLSD